MPIKEEELKKEIISKTKLNGGQNEYINFI